MKVKVNVLAKPHPYIFFKLPLDSIFEISAESAPIHAVIISILHFKH